MQVYYNVHEFLNSHECIRMAVLLSFACYFPLLNLRHGTIPTGKSCYTVSSYIYYIILDWIRLD